MVDSLVRFVDSSRFRKRCRAGRHSRAQLSCERIRHTPSNVLPFYILLLTFYLLLFLLLFCPFFVIIFFSLRQLSRGPSDFGLLVWPERIGPILALNMESARNTWIILRATSLPSITPRLRMTVHISKRYSLNCRVRDGSLKFVFTVRETERVGKEARKEEKTRGRKIEKLGFYLRGIFCSIYYKAVEFHVLSRISRGIIWNVLLGRFIREEKQFF